jgi:hypothetical protein
MDGEIGLGKWRRPPVQCGADPVVAVPTAVHLRDPVIAWSEQLGTLASDPLDNYLDPLPRGQYLGRRSCKLPANRIRW